MFATDCVRCSVALLGQRGHLARFPCILVNLAGLVRSFTSPTITRSPIAMDIRSTARGATSGKVYNASILSR